MLVSVYPLRVRGRRLKAEAIKRQTPVRGDLRTYQQQCHLVAALEPALPLDARPLPPLYDPKLVLISRAGCKPSVDTLDRFREDGGRRERHH